MRQMIESVQQNALLIRSDDPEVLRKGRLIQFLIILLTSIGLGFLFFGTLNALMLRPTQPPFGDINPGFVILFPIMALSWWFARNGRMRRSSHVFAAGTSLIFLFTYIAQPNPSIPYLILIGVVAIAVLDSVKVSALYAVINTTLFIILFTLLSDFNLIEITQFLLITAGVYVTVWATASELNDVANTTRDLNIDIFKKNALLQSNANLLRVSNEVVQLTSQSLNLADLFENAVNTIKSRFGFFYVALYLLDAEKQKLTLKQVASDETAETSWTLSEIDLAQNASYALVVTTKRPQILHQAWHLASKGETQSPILQILLPLATRSELHGILELHAPSTPPLHEQEIDILQLMSNQIGVNIDNAILFEQTKAQFTQTKTLFDLTNNLTSTNDPGEIFRRVVAEFAKQLAADYAELYGFDEANRLHLQANYPASTTQVGFTDSNGDTTVFINPDQRVFSQKASVYDVQNDSKSTAQQRRFRYNNGGIVLEIPLQSGAQNLGLAHIYRSELATPFSNDEIQLGQAMANQTAIVLQNAILTSNTRGQLAQFRSLLRLSGLLAEASTLEEIYRGARREIFSLIEAFGMSIMLLTQDKQSLKWSYGYEFGQEVDISKIPSLPLSEGFSGYVAKSMEILSIAVTEETSKKYRSFTVGHGEGGYWTGLPLTVSTQLIGVMAIESETAVYTKELELLKTIAGPLGIAINNILQLRALEETLAVQYRQRLQLQTAAEVAASATQIQSLDKLLQTAVDLIKDRFDLYYVGLFLINPKRTFAVLYAGTGHAGKAQIANGHQLEVGGRSLIGGATRDGKPRIIQDVLQNDEWRANSHLPLTRSELALPLRLPDKTIGALTVQSEQPNIFDNELVNTFQTLADQLTVAIDNLQRLEETKRQAADQRWLNEMSSRLHQSAQVDKIIEVGLTALSTRFHNAPVGLRLGSQHDDAEDS